MVMGWATVPLRALITPISQKNRPDLPLLSVVREKGVVLRDHDKSENHNVIPDDLSGYKVVRSGQFVINKMKAWQGSCGVSQYDGIVSPAYFVFDLQGVLSRFFNYAIRSKRFVDEFGRISSGVRVGQWDLSLEKLKYILFFLPPIDEQNQIVRFLDWKVSLINKLINSKKRQIALLQEQRDVVIQTVFDNLSAKTISCRHIAIFQNGISESGNFFVDGDYPFVNYSDVYKNDILPNLVKGTAKSNAKQQVVYSVLEGDIFFTRTSEILDEVGLTSVCFETIEKAVFSGFLIRMRPKHGMLDKNYSRYYFRSKNVRDYFTKEMNSVIRASLGQNLLKNLPVILPALSEQKAIAEKLDHETSAFDKLTATIEKEITLLQEFRTRLISDIVTGVIEVKEIIIPKHDVVEETASEVEEEPEGKTEE
jgi:type I restriction enzyme S subunit